MVKFIKEAKVIKQENDYLMAPTFTKVKEELLDDELFSLDRLLNSVYNKENGMDASDNDKKKKATVEVKGTSKVNDEFNNGRYIV